MDDVRYDGVLYYDSENFVHMSKGELSVFDRLPTASLIVRGKKGPGCERMTKTGKDDNRLKEISAVKQQSDRDNVQSQQN